jgi:hypothetical protein
MPITNVGTLPVSAINVGLVACVSGLGVESAKLGVDISGLNAALAGKFEVSANFPPPAPSYAAGIVTQLDPLEVAAQFLPGNWPTMGASASIDTLAKLGIVEGQLAIVENVTASITAGLTAGGISGWSYAGGASGFGESLTDATASGFGKVAADTEIQAVIIGTESFSSWGSFAQGFDVGTSAAAPAVAAAPRLAFLGEQSAGDWNSGVADVAARLDLFVAELRGLKAALEAQLQLALGLNLPDAQVVVDAGLAIMADVGIDGLMLNMVNVQADIDGELEGISVQLDVVLALSADLSAQLSAGGLTFWTYTGPASGLGAALRSETQDGIPGGSGPSAPAYGVVLAGAAPSMALFGNIFKTS